MSAAGPSDLRRSGTGRVQQAQQPQRDGRRPRSPEGKVSGPRAQSPGSKQSPPERAGRAVPGSSGSAAQAAQAPGPAPGGGAGAQPQVRRGTSSTLEEIKRIDANREHRRRAAEEARRSRQEEAALLGAQCGGHIPDIDFHRMIRDFRQQCPAAQPAEPLRSGDAGGIVVCVRKRPIQQHEMAQRELDCVTACNPFAIVHESKFRVDGITKCLESHQFEFDRVFDEDASTDDVYRTVAEPLVPWAIERGGRVTVFAYGQTGSGKTHTMTGLQRLLAEQIFGHRRRSSDPLEVSLSFFEIYGGRPYDLLNSRQRLDTLEDARNEVQIAGLTERSAGSPEEMLQCIELGNSLRTTHATAINRDSSRSHAVCAVFLKLPGGGPGGAAAIHAKITLVDLAGSERAADSKSTIRQRRVEGAQINKSLLALKECIRAMGDPREAHVPFRASKLTLVLRDAFVSRCPSRTVMIACISPGMTSADHSVNTLRYSDRLKDHPRVARPLGEARLGVEEAVTEVVERERPRAAAAAPPVRASESPGPGVRRSPSPMAAEPQGGQRFSRPRALSSGGLEPPREERSEAAHGEERLRPGELPDEPPRGPAVAWEDMRPGAAPAPEVHRGGAAVAGGGAVPSGSRQHVSRRGRQPTFKPREAGAPARSDALGGRGPVAVAEAPVCEDVAPTALPPEHLQQQASHPQLPGSPQRQPLQDGGAPVAHRASGSTTLAAERAARAHAKCTSTSPERSHASRGGDLSRQDDRYLHNTLTSEVFERSGDPSGVMDVGIEDLTDLEHLEALDEVRQWEDRIISQHMVAVQEDARLLTEESALLSQVQQGASYDIDWYVSQVDKVVRRKMDVYQGFLEDLEVFKAQLHREETLSRSCQRHRDAGLWGIDGDGDLDEPSRPSHLSGGEAHEAAQRAPRTPRAPGGGNVGAPDRGAEELSAHAAALEEANAMLRLEADRARRRVSALEEEARATAAAKDAQIATLEERIAETSQMLDASAEKPWTNGLAAAQRMWRAPNLPF